MTNPSSPMSSALPGFPTSLYQEISHILVSRLDEVSVVNPKIRDLWINVGSEPQVVFEVLLSTTLRSFHKNPPTPANARGSAPGKKSFPTTLYYCYTGTRAEAAVGIWFLFFFFFSFLSVSEGRLGRSFAPILGLSVLQGRAVLLSGNVFFVTFLLFFFLSVFRRDVRHSLDAFLGLPRPSLPLCFAVREAFL